MTETRNYIPALKYDWLTKVYDPFLQFTMPEKKFKKALINQMNIQPGYYVLDFGCGSITLSLMAAMAHPQAEFLGVDIDEKILTIAKEKMANSGLSMDVQQYDGRKLPYADGSFDRVMSSLVFHHLTLHQKYSSLTEIYRILKPLGEVHIADFGKPANGIQRLGFYGVQILDGFETTKDSVKDLLPQVMEETNFLRVQETESFNTLFGTVRLMKGIKQGMKILQRERSEGSKNLE